MNNNEVTFGGFKKEGSQNVQDLPKRPEPQKIPTYEQDIWVPNPDDTTNNKTNKEKVLATKVIGTILPIAGIFTILAAIGTVVFVMLQVYR